MAKTIAESFARKKTKPAWCKQLYKSTADRILHVRDSIRVKKYYITYYKILLGIIPSNSGSSWRDFKTIDERLAAEITALQDEREALNNDYNSAEAQIKILEKSIEELEKKAGHAKIDTKQKLKRYKSAQNIKDKLKILEQELANDGFSIEDLESLFVKIKEEKEK